MARWQNKAPFKRLGHPDDVADACLFLASPAARWITGANLVVDGGVTTARHFELTPYPPGGAPNNAPIK